MVCSTVISRWFWVLDKLKALQQTEDVPPALDREGLAHLEFSDEPEEVRERCIALRQAIFSFPKESAPGPRACALTN